MRRLLQRKSGKGLNFSLFFAIGEISVLGIGRDLPKPKPKPLQNKFKKTSSFSGENNTFAPWTLLFIFNLFYCFLENWLQPIVKNYFFFFSKKWNRRI